MTDDQLLEFAKKWRCTHPGCAPWLDLTEDHFVKVARAIEQASRRAALEEANWTLSERGLFGAAELVRDLGDK
jgi:hypothetical protein